MEIKDYKNSNYCTSIIPRNVEFQSVNIINLWSYCVNNKISKCLELTEPIRFIGDITSKLTLNLIINQ